MLRHNTKTIAKDPKAINDKDKYDLIGFLLSLFCMSKSM